jgi:hypothetical protein
MKNSWIIIMDPYPKFITPLTTSWRRFLSKSHRNKLRIPHRQNFRAVEVPCYIIKISVRTSGESEIIGHQNTLMPSSINAVSTDGLYQVPIEECEWYQARQILQAKSSL